MVLTSMVACTSAPGPTNPSGSAPAPVSVSPVEPTSPTPSPEPIGDSGLVRLGSPAHGSFLVRGVYPDVHSPCLHAERPRLTARYPGTLAVRRADDGTLSLVVTLSFESYLRGIAEVPPSWPAAALDAQAIAARSYALATTGWSGQQGETLDTPICSTSSCQVYGGIPVEPVSDIGRWYAAVERTAGLVLLSDGRPADTVYFSTSNGHTYGNEAVFGSDPLPYLRPVVESDDGASPTSRWQARIGLHDLARFLSRAGAWPGGVPITSVAGDGASVRVTGASGSPVMIDGSTFRDAVNTWAPCLRPGVYPQGGLPTTIPSRWMTAASSGGAMTVTGRGWGHGVGMVQWGAYGKALRGWSAARILGYYYGGLRPRHYPEPGLIHVEVASGLTSVRLRASGAGATLDGEPVDAGTLVITGGDQLSVGGTAFPA